MLDQILALYGIMPSGAKVQTFGDGLINHTWKIETPSSAYIVQKVNQAVFNKPFDIDENLSILKQYLDVHHPDYLFVAPLADLSGSSLVHNEDGYFRIFPFIEGSHSLNVLEKPEEASEAAKQFGRFSHILSEFDAPKLNITLPDFHNLSLRYEQFLNALNHASYLRKEKAEVSIMYILEHNDIVETFKHIADTKEIPLRVIHHDTKINNVLFDKENHGLCIIDLDTVMPGYFISDVGDMMRTYLSPANEEETDMSRIKVRSDFFKSIYQGYMSEMGNTLTETEKGYFIYAGKFLIYMQAIRFLTDYLQNDIYYGARYEDHNLNRAVNQLTLLQRYFESENEFIDLTRPR